MRQKSVDVVYWPPFQVTDESGKGTLRGVGMFVNQLGGHYKLGVEREKIDELPIVNSRVYFAFRM